MKRIKPRHSGSSYRLLYNPLVVRKNNAALTHEADFYTTRGVAPWWSAERTHRLLYNQRSLPLVVRRENSSLSLRCVNITRHQRAAGVEPSLLIGP